MTAPDVKDLNQHEGMKGDDVNASGLGLTITRRFLWKRRENGNLES